MKILVKKRSIAILLLMALFSLSMSTEAYSQKKKKKEKEIATESQQNIDYGQTVTLVTSSTGSTKEEATKNALRSAIEQAFGTFVSANTSVVNDELVKDEIVTISSGNVKSYNEIDCQMKDNNLYEITLQAIVSIDNLVHFAQNHGMSAELAGQTFAMNIKISQLNKANENKALEHLIIQLYDIAKKGLYDFSIDVRDPIMEDGIACVKVYVKPTPNDNYRAYVDLAKKTVYSLSMSETEFENLRSLGTPGYVCGWGDIEYNDNGISRKDFFEKDKGDIRLRNDINGGSLGQNELHEIMDGANFIYYYERFKHLSKFAFSIQDNLGNRIDPKFNLDRGNDYKRSYNKSKVEAQVVSGNKLRPNKNPVGYWSWVGYSEVSASGVLGYSMSDVSKLAKIEVVPVQIDLLDNEILMDVAKGEAETKKMFENAANFLSLADKAKSAERLHYLKMADDLYELLETHAVRKNYKDAIINIRNIRKEIKAKKEKR